MIGFEGKSFMHQIQTRRNTSSQFLLNLALYVPFLVICGVIFWLSSLSHPPIPSFMKFHNGDKVMHAVAFFCVGFAAVLPLAFRKTLFTFWVFVRGLALAAVYAALDEVHQAYVPMRDSSYLDFSADIFGATLGVFTFWVMMSLIRRGEKQKAP